MNCWISLVPVEGTVTVKDVIDPGERLEASRKSPAFYIATGYLMPFGASNAYR